MKYSKGVWDQTNFIEGKHKEKSKPPWKRRVGKASYKRPQMNFEMALNKSWPRETRDMNRTKGVSLIKSFDKVKTTILVILMIIECVLGLVLYKGSLQECECQFIH